jgi:hypothetical protein
MIEGIPGGARSGAVDERLRFVIQAWPNLSEAVRRKLLRPMRHKLQSTTEGYIYFAESVRPVAMSIDVPDVLSLPDSKDDSMIA